MKCFTIFKDKRAKIFHTVVKSLTLLSAHFRSSSIRAINPGNLQLQAQYTAIVYTDIDFIGTS